MVRNGTGSKVGRDQSYNNGDENQPGGCSNHHSNERTPSGARWDDREGDYEDEGDLMDGGDESKGGL